MAITSIVIIPRNVDSVRGERLPHPIFWSHLHSYIDAVNIGRGICIVWMVSLVSDLNYLKFVMKLFPMKPASSMYCKMWYGCIFMTGGEEIRKLGEKFMR